MFYHADGRLKQLALVDKSTVFMMAGCTSLVVIGFLVTDSLFRYIYPKFRVLNIDNIKAQRLHFAPLFLVISLTAFVAITKFQDSSPLMILISGDAELAKTARLSGFSDHYNFWGIKPSYLQVFFEIASFVSIVFLVKYMAVKKIRYLGLYILSVGIVVLDSITNVSKGGILIPLYQVWVVYALIHAKGQVLNRIVIWALLITIFGVSSITSIMMANDTVDFLYPFERLFLGNLVPQYVIMNYFNFENLLWGTSLPTWWSLGNHQQFLLDEFAWKTVMGWRPGQSFYTAPSSFVADSFANFHIIGVFVVSIMIFSMLKLIDILLASIRNDFLYCSLLVYCALHFSYWATGGTLNFLFDYYLYGVLIFALLFYKKYRF